MKVAALRRIEDHERRERDRLQRELTVVEEALQRLSSARDELVDERARAARDLAPGLHDQYQLWCRLIDGRIAELDGQLAQARERREAARVAVLAQHRRLRSIEHLHHQARERERRQRERQLARQGDELAVRNWLAEARA